MLEKARPSVSRTGGRAFCICMKRWRRVLVLELAEYEILLDPDKVNEYCRRAAKNKNGTAKAGPLLIRRKVRK